PAELVAAMNEYLSAMTDVIETHGGFVDKYFGDAIVAVFGAPLDDPDHAMNAVHAALRCAASLGTLDRVTAAFGGTVRQRLGLTTGEALVGNIGSRRRFNYTVMGDVVNLASRLEGSNKLYGTTIIASEATVTLTGLAFVWRELDAIRVKGRRQAVRIFEPLGVAGEVAPELLSRAQAHGAGLTRYRARGFAAAAEEFALVQAMIRRRRYSSGGSVSSRNSPQGRTGKRSVRRRRNSARTAPGARSMLPLAPDRPRVPTELAVCADFMSDECVLGRLVAQERGDLRVRLELRQILRGGQLRLVARGVHHAQEAERLPPGGAELMPGHRRHGHEIAGLDRFDFVADETMAAPAQDQHGVHVPVPFQARETTGRHLEIAQLAMELRIGEQHLPRDRLEQRAIVFLVRKLLHAFPAVILRLAVDRSLARGHHPIHA